MAHEQFQQHFRNSVAAALKKFAETSGMAHAGLKGRFREMFIADLLWPILSGDFLVGSGLVADHKGGTSREADVVIFDKFHVPPLLYKVNEGLFPIEGVYYYGEIKSKLNKAELVDAIRKFRALRLLSPLPNAQGQSQFPPRFIFAWSSDLQGDRIEDELERYTSADESALKDPAATILCVVGKGYCCVVQGNDGKNSWYKIGQSDGVQEVVNFIGGVANSLIDFRVQKFGVKFGHYIIPYAQSVKLRDIE